VFQQLAGFDDKRRRKVLWGMELLPVPVLGELVELLCKVARGSRAWISADN
jgi:hypothetical protein